MICIEVILLKLVKKNKNKQKLALLIRKKKFKMISKKKYGDTATRFPNVRLLLVSVLDDTLQVDYS